MAKHDWIMSVLDDLETYAKTNELLWLRDELNKAKLIAISELSGDLEGMKAPAHAVKHKSRLH